MKCDFRYTDWVDDMIANGRIKRNFHSRQIPVKVWSMFKNEQAHVITWPRDRKAEPLLVHNKVTPQWSPHSTPYYLSQLWLPLVFDSRAYIPLRSFIPGLRRYTESQTDRWSWLVEVGLGAIPIDSLKKRHFGTPFLRIDITVCTVFRTLLMTLFEPHS